MQGASPDPLARAFAHAERVARAVTLARAFPDEYTITVAVTLPFGLSFTVTDRFPGSEPITNRPADRS